MEIERATLIVRTHLYRYVGPQRGGAGGAICPRALLPLLAALQLRMSKTQSITISLHFHLVPVSCKQGL